MSRFAETPHPHRKKERGGGGERERVGRREVGIEEDRSSRRQALRTFLYILGLSSNKRAGKKGATSPPPTHPIHFNGVCAKIFSWWDCAPC